MLVTTKQWLSSTMMNGTRNEFHSSIDNHNNSQYSLSIEPTWASLSLITIILFTVCGNSLVCIAVIRERHLRNTTNYFLTSLAFTDCLVACLVMPIAVTIELIGHFPFNALACNVWLTFDVCCSTSSIWHMSVMSLDRYLTLRYPLKYGRNKRRSLMAYKIITIWLISFGICLPLFILGLVDPTNVYNEATRACFPSHRTFKIYGSFVAFFIPLVIMVVTYALTMSALQQAHTTKKNRYTRRQKMHAVINLATMAMRWKRAVNNDTADEQKTSNESVAVKSDEKNQTISSTSESSHCQRKRATSLLEPSQYASGKKGLVERIFTSNYRLNEPRAPITWHKRKEKVLQPLDEKSTEQASPSSIRHLVPESPNNHNTHAKRSHSCTPLLDVEDGRKSRRRRSSSAHTILQIRRDSAKIREELERLTAQLSAAMNNDGTSGKRLSLSVPGAPDTTANETPTIDQLLAETAINQPIIIPSSYLLVDQNMSPPTHNNFHLQLGRSHSADTRLASFDSTDDKAMMSNGIHVPNLLVTHDSTQNLPLNTNNNNNNNDDAHNISHNNKNSNSLNILHKLEPMTRRLTSPSKFDTTCQRIKDWITVTTSSTTLDLHSNIRSRCVSAVNVTENTPMLAGQKSQLHNSPLSNLKRYFPRMEHLYGQAAAPNAIPRSYQASFSYHHHQPQQLLLVDDHVASVHSFAAMQRSSVSSITSTMLAARLMRAHRPSTSSSIGSTSQKGLRRRPPRLNDVLSQASFQMVSLDTEDSSSGSSSLTHQSANVKAAIAGTNAPPAVSAPKKHPTFRNLTKTSASNERKAMRVLLIIFSIFVILWTPFFVINLLSCFIADMHPIFISVATWLGYCSSGANPIIYTIFSRTFRRAFFNILTCRKVITSHRSQVFNPSCHSMTMSMGRKMSIASRGPADIR
ncbi:unnamed protein product [Adineta ricciae]|uniref:G-protein coupled receptors family 1 profile domain-containing protein n=1 Tax=Adineta ricciae TaxID=249248 RepID=A0A813U2R7_ADIRI|nr:unnamed protein product [Adineta ricciae]CAF0817920.1 unnamed protein product [Adineta ricciae]